MPPSPWWPSLVSSPSRSSPSRHYSDTSFETLDACAQDSAAPAQVGFLLRVETRTSQIDEIKIDAVEVGATQVGPAQVCLADFFRRLVRLVVIVVGVEPRPPAPPAPRTSDPPPAA